MLAPAGLWQKATETDGSIRAPIECVPNFEVSYLRVAQPLNHAYSTNAATGDKAQVVRVVRNFD